MSRGTNQKFKLSFLSRIMLEKTDDEHSLTMPQIMAELEKYDVTAERKSVYQDMEKLGIEIIKEQIGRETYYHVGSREFELAEVKLLIDAIQSSKFITQTKSRELITKIKKFASEYQASQLQRHVFIDRFGKDISFRKVDDDHSMVAVDVAVSHQFFGWIFSLGREVKVVGLDEVVEQMKIAAEEFVRNYQ